MFGFIEKLFTGYSVDDLQTESDSLDAKLQQQNDAALNRGAIDQATYDATEQNIQNGRIDASTEVGGAFKEGLAEGVDNVRGTIGDIVTSPLKLIDWRLYVIGGLALLVYMGGWTYLKGIIPRKAS